MCFAEALDGIGEIEIDAEAGFANAAAFIANRFGVAGSNVARNKIAKAGIAAFEIVIALGFGDLIRRAFVACFERNPDAAVVAQRFAHESELRLIIAGDGNAGGVNLREARIGEESAAFVGAPDGGNVRSFSVRGQIINVAVAAGAEDDRIGEMRFEFAGDEIAGDDAAGDAIDHDEIEHFGAREHGDAAGFNLPFESLIGAEEKLLACLAAGVEGSRNLRATEGAIRKGAAVFAGERDALRHALIDNVNTDLRQAVDIGFASAEIAAFDGVVEEAVDAIAIVLIILGGVDAALRRDGVRAARRILEAEALDVIAEFA